MAAFKKLSATKIVDAIIIATIIVAFAIGGYNYSVQSLPPPLKKAEFQVTNLIVDPLEVGVGQPITISVNVTNVGEETGNYSATLLINDVAKETKTVQLSGNESRTVDFTVIESNVGSYSVKIEGLTGTFTILAEPPPSTFKASNLKIYPYEAWPDQPIKITINLTNTGDKAGSYSLAFKVNDEVKATKTIQLSAGETAPVEANVTENGEGTYTVNVAGLTGKFIVVPTGKHTLGVVSAPWGLTFTINGVSHITTYTELLDVGEYTIVIPDSFQQIDKDGYLEIYQFFGWADGFPDSVRTVDLQSRTILIVNYKMVASCPSLYVWNGTNYVYRGEVSAGTGYLPYFVCFGENHTRVFGYSDPWDYIKLDATQVTPRNDYYDMILTELSNEIFYADSVRLLIIDHSPDVDVFSTYGTRKYVLEDQGTIYTVSTNPLTPVSAVYEAEDVLTQISELDGIYATIPGWEYGQFNTLELNLGNLSDAKEIKLIVAGTVSWPSSEVTTKWTAKFVDQPGEPPFPVQYMEVRAENGSWVRVPDSRQFPMLPASPSIFVVNLTGLFPTNDYSLRINTFFDWHFDYIGVDITQQQDMIIREIYPAYADFTKAFESDSASTGNFTRYGNVTELMLEADDKFVIGRRGDQIHLLFPVDTESVPENMVRDYFVIVSCWFKLPGLPYLAFTVDPLPFHDMSCFPYPPTESYPYDENHLNYLTEYNTREIGATP